MSIPSFVNLAEFVGAIKVLGGKETPHDNQLIAAHYSCECGHQMKIIGHRYNISKEKQVLDTYVLNCPHCGDRKVLFFQMPLKKVKEALEDDLNKIIKMTYYEENSVEKKIVSY